MGDEHGPKCICDAGDGRGRADGGDALGKCTKAPARPPAPAPSGWASLSRPSASPRPRPSVRPPVPRRRGVARRARRTIRPTAPPTEYCCASENLGIEHHHANNGHNGTKRHKKAWPALKISNMKSDLTKGPSIGTSRTPLYRAT